MEKQLRIKKFIHIDNSLQDKAVIVSGWIEDIRLIGSLMFVILRDSSGVLQLVVKKNNIDIDGISLTPILNGQSEIDREDIFWHFPHYHGSLWKPGSAIRSGDWKLVFHYESNNAELFNLKEDPGEINDLSLLFEEKKQILLNKLNNLKNETNANKVSINPNFKN